MGNIDIESLADAYIDQYVDPIYRSHDNVFLERTVDWPAAQAVIDLTLRGDPELVWQFVLSVIDKTDNKQLLSLVAAGPLEDLIDEHGPRFIERVEVLARSNTRFREMLHGVWRSSTPEIWARVESARGACCGC
jgi:hypothetical protein